MFFRHNEVGGDCKRTQLRLLESFLILCQIWFILTQKKKKSQSDRFLGFVCDVLSLCVHACSAHSRYVLHVARPVRAHSSLQAEQRRSSVMYSCLGWAVLCVNTVRQLIYSGRNINVCLLHGEHEYGNGLH